MLRFILVSLLVACVICVSSGCDVLKDTHHGCKIENSQCICAYGCKSEYRYTTKKECTDSLKGRASDVCSHAPCLNGGNCIQISLNPGFKCKCEGTRFYGARCQRPCPKDGHIPYECVEI